MKNKIVALFLVLTFFLTAGPGCGLPQPGDRNPLEPVTLEYWRAYDGSDAFQEIIEDYIAIHPNVNINYRKLTPEEYEEELIDSLAEDRGPDIFSIQNTKIIDYQNKISPMPAKVKVLYQTETGGFRSEIVNEVREVRTMTIKELREKFVDTVHEDVVLEHIDGTGKTLGDKIYGLPLSIDTLAMYYNKDLLNNAGIIEPPKYWDKTFQQTVKKLTKQNNKGLIIQSGVAMGSSKNVERSQDILALLMMQNGAILQDEYNRVSFQNIPEGLTHYPSVGALDFYSDFSDPGKEVYCWNNNMVNSLEAFTQGNVAIMFGYAYHIPIIKTRAPKLNFSIAKMPQIENNPIINYPNYWVETVSAKSKYNDEAWAFIQFITKAEEAKKYLEKTSKPTALRSLAEEQMNDIEIGVFAEQVLTAKSWYHGNDIEKTEQIFNDMIDLTAKGELETAAIIKQASNRVQQTINK